MKKEKMKKFIFLYPAGLVLGIIMGELTDNILLGIGMSPLLGGILLFVVTRISSK